MTVVGNLAFGLEMRRVEAIRVGDAARAEAITRELVSKAWTLIRAALVQAPIASPAHETGMRADKRAGQ